MGAGNTRALHTAATAKRRQKKLQLVVLYSTCAIQSTLLQQTLIALSSQLWLTHPSPTINYTPHTLVHGGLHGSHNNCSKQQRKYALHAYLPMLSSSCTAPGV